MNLGWCDVCLCVKDAGTSERFYEGLGFRRVEGEDGEGWAVVTNGDLRLGLFEAKYMDDDAMSLNFRGGDVQANAEALIAQGYRFASGPKQGSGGGWSASLRDPDGRLIFFDSAAGEVKKE